MLRFARLSQPLAVALVAGGLVFGGAGGAAAEPVAPSEVKNRTEPLPRRLEGVDVVEHLEARVPAQLAFHDDRGRDVLYDEAVRGRLPTILTLNYSDCPMLCSLQLDGLIKGLKGVDLTLGRDYRIVTVSLDPAETPESAGKLKRRYLAQYGRPEADANGWSVLTGSEANIRAVATALGFTYNYNEARDEYAHPAAVVLTTPDGVLSRYLYGLEYHEKTLRLSLIEASEGKIGSSIDRLILYCFHYDASEGRYAPVAMNIMRLTGGGFALALGALLASLWAAERRKARPSGGGRPSSGPTGPGADQNQPLLGSTS
jgi:protein SCO1/2